MDLLRNDRRQIWLIHNKNLRESDRRMEQLVGEIYSQNLTNSFFTLKRSIKNISYRQVFEHPQSM